jgi:hypothetical protein
MQPGQVHEGQAPQVQHDVAHPTGLWFQTVKHFGDLRNREKVEFAAKRDQGGATVRTSLDGELLCGELLCDGSGALL